VSPRWMASDDEGRRFVGHEAIRRWSDREFIVARGRMTVTGVSNTKSGVTINADFEKRHQNVKHWRAIVGRHGSPRAP
jgi:hypothetical protein